MYFLLDSCGYKTSVKLLVHWISDRNVLSSMLSELFRLRKYFSIKAFTRLRLNARN